MLVASCIVYAMNAAKAPLYAAKTTFFITQSAQPDQKPSYDDLLFNERMIPTYAELIRTSPILKSVISELGLSIDQETLLNRTEIIVVRNTQLMQLQVEDQDPQVAADIANTMIRVFNESQATKQQIETSARQQELIAELGEALAKNKATEERLHTAQAAHNVTETQRLSETLTQDQHTYNALNEQIAAMQNDSTAFDLQLTIAEPARAIPVSVRANTTILTGLGAILGAIAGTVLAFALALLNTRIYTYQDAADIAKLKMLRPVLPIGLPRRGVSALEMYRELCLYSGITTSPGPHTWLLSSAAAFFDSSEMVMLLGIMLAQTGRRVVLVDTKFGQPSLHSVFGRSNVIGLSDALQRQRPLVRDYLQQLTDQNLFLLPTGPNAPEVSNQLASRRFEWLVKQLQREFDVVLFHAPAPQSSGNAATVGRLCDVALLVVGAGTIRKHSLRRVVEQLAATGTAEICMVLAKRARAIDRLAGFRARLGARLPNTAPEGLQGRAQAYSMAQAVSPTNQHTITDE